MSTPSAHSDEPRPEYRYHMLRAASERFQSNLTALDVPQMQQVERIAQQTFDIETLVLCSDEARDTQIPGRRIDQAVEAIRGRYADEDAFLGDLEANGLDLDTLHRALQRELIFDAVMQRVGARAEAVTEVDARLFYELHADRFEAPERRTARHILITVNEEYGENTREAAMARIAGIAAELQDHPERFGELAKRHSECPTAVEAGALGTLPRGKLYPALDAALFELPEGRISGVLESEIGLHLLLCERIEAAKRVGFEQAQAQIQEALEARRRRDCQKTWLAALRQQAPPSPERSTA